MHVKGWIVQVLHLEQFSRCRRSNRDGSISAKHTRVVHICLPSAYSVPCDPLWWVPSSCSRPSLLLCHLSPFTLTIFTLWPLTSSNQLPVWGILSTWWQIVTTRYLAKSRVFNHTVVSRQSIARKRPAKIHGYGYHWACYIRFPRIGAVILNVYNSYQKIQVWHLHFTAVFIPLHWYSLFIFHRQ